VGVMGDWKVTVSSKGPEWMGFATMSKTSVFQVSGFFLPQHKRLRPDINYVCGYIKYKDRIFCVRVK
jgi:hypothetical protein